MMNIEFINGKFGIKAIVKTIWQDSFLKVLLEKRVNELELNTGKGWNGESVDFLQYFPDLEALILINQRIKSVEEIHYLRNLKELTISTYSKKSIDFSCFPKLVNCNFEWITGSESLFKNQAIKNLGINSYSGKSSAVFSQLINLEKLTILNSNIEDLNGIFILKNLKYLSITNLKKINSLDGIKKLYQLEDLEIQRCRGLNKISEIFELTELRKLFLLDLGEIDSIKGIQELKKLEIFLFYESTNIVDGDISPLLELKKLTKISFQNRRHYTHRREDFGKLYN